MVIALFNILARDRRTQLSLWYRRTPHHFFEVRLIPKEYEADGLFAGVFKTYPSACGNEHQRPGLGFILPLSKPNVGIARLNQKDLVFAVVPVLRNDCAWSDLFRTQKKMSGPVDARTDLQHEITGG
jgi:hypothetical protein